MDIFKDSVLGTLLLVNMIYLGGKIDKLTKAIYSSIKKQRRTRR